MARPDFEDLGITDRCSRCGRPYDEHPHALGEKCVIPNPHAFRTQPLRFGNYGWPDDHWPDGRWDHTSHYERKTR